MPVKDKVPPGVIGLEKEMSVSKRGPSTVFPSGERLICWLLPVVCRMVLLSLLSWIPAHVDGIKFILEVTAGSDLALLMDAMTGNEGWAFPAVATYCKSDSRSAPARGGDLCDGDEQKVLGVNADIVVKSIHQHSSTAFADAALRGR